MDVSPLAGLPAEPPAAALAGAEPPPAAAPPAAGADAALAGAEPPPAAAPPAPGADAALAGADAGAGAGAGADAGAGAGAGALAALAAPEALAAPAGAPAGAPAEVAAPEALAAPAGAPAEVAAPPAAAPPAAGADAALAGADAGAGAGAGALAAAPPAAGADAGAGAGAGAQAAAALAADAGAGALAAAEPAGEAPVAPASKLQELFNTALFTNNNYIRIFELLNKKNIILIDNILVYKTNFDLYISYTTLNNLIKINNFYNISNDVEKTNKIAKLKNIMNRIINEDITNNIQNDIIVDPAGLDYVYNNFDGAGGLSRAIYNILTEKASLLPQFELKSTDNEYDFLNNLFTNNDIIDAGYKEYTDKSDTSGKTKINIIHSIGPNFSELKNKKYLNYKTFKKIYDDIINVFKTKSNNKLRLCALSSGLFAANYKDEIIYILALVFIELCINEPKENFDMYIIEVDNGRKKDNQYLYNLFKYNVEYIVKNIIKLF
jgi:hypothetical protein